MTIPKEFTGCEVYRGHTIAIQQGRYSIWNARGMCQGGWFATRADARRGIDLQIEDRKLLTPRYNAEAVEQAIRSSRQPIGGREARMIHAILKGYSK